MSPERIASARSIRRADRALNSVHAIFANSIICFLLCNPGLDCVPSARRSMREAIMRRRPGTPVHLTAGVPHQRRTARQQARADWVNLFACAGALRRICDAVTGSQRFQSGRSCSMCVAGLVVHPTFWPTKSVSSLRVTSGANQMKSGPSRRNDKASSGRPAAIE